MHHHYYRDAEGHIAVIYKRDQECAPYIVARCFPDAAIELHFDAFVDAIKQLEVLGRGWKETPVISTESEAFES